VLTWGEFVAVQLSSFSSSEAKCWWQQIYGWSRYGNSRDTIADDTWHLLLSIGKRKSVHHIINNSVVAGTVKNWWDGSNVESSVFLLELKTKLCVCVCVRAPSTFVNLFFERIPCIVWVPRARNSCAIFVLVYMYVDMNRFLCLEIQAQAVWRVCSRARARARISHRRSKAFYVWELLFSLCEIWIFHNIGVEGFWFSGTVHSAVGDLTYTSVLMHHGALILKHD
jgi:hypothetical protein